MGDPEENVTGLTLQKIKNERASEVFLKHGLMWPSPISPILCLL